MEREHLETILAGTDKSTEELLTTMNESDAAVLVSEVHQHNTGVSSSSSEEDVYTALANRERDLMLAAELGKALLDKNEELNRKNDQLVEEYTHKIEQLTQERHGLRLKLENLEAEYQTTVKDLQSDVTQLQQALEERQNSTRSGHEKTQHYIIDELTLQNEKLSLQLTKAAESERHLQAQLRELHEEMDLRRHSMHEHVQHLDTLTTQETDSEMTEVCGRKQHLERRIHDLLHERNSLSASLEESHDRMQDLEQQNKRQQSQIVDQEKNIQELQERNMQLQERLSGPTTMTSLEGSSTLFSELQMSGLAQAMSTESLDEPGAVKIGQQLRQEILEVYRQLNHMVMELRGTGDRWSPETLQIHDMKVGSLLTVLKDLRDVVFSTIYKTADKDSLDGQSLSADLQDYLEHQDMKIQDLKRDVGQAQTHVTKIVREMQYKDEQIQRYVDQVHSLTSRITEQHSCVERLREQIDKMIDSNYDVTADDILHHVRTERDLTLKQLKCVEYELDKSRSDAHQLDTQLTAAIQQKLELSQQLELWQVDMQELIDKQVSRRMREEKKQEEERKLLRKQQHSKQHSKQTTPSKTRFSLFKKS